MTTEILDLNLIDWKRNRYNTYIAQYLESKGIQTMKYGQLIEYNKRIIFLKKSCTTCSGEAIPRPF